MLSVSEELKAQMDGHPEINWSEVARRAFREQTVKLSMLDEITGKSRLGEEDAVALGREVNRRFARQYLQ